MSVNLASDVIKIMDILDNTLFSGSREKKGRRAAAANAANAAAPQENSNSSAGASSPAAGLFGGAVAAEEELTIANDSGAMKIDNGDGMDTPPR